MQNYDVASRSALQSCINIKNHKDVPSSWFDVEMVELRRNFKKILPNIEELLQHNQNHTALFKSKVTPKYNVDDNQS